MLFSGNSNKSIYLDYAATTPVSERAFKAMRPYFSDVFYNPSSLHIPGQKAQGALDVARNSIADLIGADWKEVIFTASATESINLAIRGAVKASALKNPHIVTTNIEHSAVLTTCRELEKEGTEVTYIAVNKDGFVSSERVEEAIKENTVLVTIGYVNNEIGTVQPIAEIAEAIESYKLKAVSCKLVFHTDAVQAANYLDINVKNLGVDMMTLSSHKIYGPKGSALLYKKEGIDLVPVITGGDQERGYHSGTENIPAIVGFAEALKETGEIMEEESKKMRELQDFFITKVLNSISGVLLNGSRENRIPNNVNFCFEGKKSETLIPELDSYGIYASGGSACRARVPEPSHVIEAISRSTCAKSSLRFTLGRSTTQKDIEYTVNKIKSII
ncbi:MAG: cysteine desulfurase family protein, partial [Candidatus Spechtbacterales bacterium]